MNILVTGAGGQLGHEMQRVAASDQDNNYTFTDVAPGYECLDITDADAVRIAMEDRNIQLVINCAAYTNVDKAEADSHTADLINRQAVANLATAAASTGATLIHISTDYVFGGTGNSPRCEDDVTAPLGVYGRTKLAGEQAVRDSKCNHIIIRTAWLYSQWGRNFVKTMQSLTSTHKMVKVVFDQVGTPTFAGDLANFIAHIIRTRQLHKTGTYHFTDEGVCSWYDFALLISRLSGNECDVQPCHSSEFPSPVERPHFSVLDKTKAKHTFGFPIPHWTDSLRLCISQLANNSL